jgi:hypothetical protein
MRQHPRSLATIVAVVLTLAGARPAAAFHTVFEFRADRFEIDGNALGAADGAPDLVDEFSDGSLAPNWYNPFGTAFENGGFLVLTNPGTHYPSPDGTLVDVSIGASTNAARVYDGSGDFTAIAYWDPVVPDLGHHYHFSAFTYGGAGGLYNEIFGLAILRSDAGLQVEQHLTEIDQYAGIYQNTMLDYVSIDEADVTGRIVFRIDYDDATNTATSSFSLDDGGTWQSPFASAPIFQGRTVGQFLLSADPTAGPSGSTTTSTTTTTLPPGPCSAVGCRRGTVAFMGSLGIKDKATDSADSLGWKWKKGAATDLVDFGDPFTTTSYELCIGAAAGTPLLTVTVPPGGTCGATPCWMPVGTGF